MAGHSVDLWWVDLRAMDHRLLARLDLIEGERARGLQRAGDLARFVLGAALLRVAVAAATGRDPGEVSIDRTCEECGGPHGRPVVDGVHVSVAHAGHLVAVATSPQPVGVDVERVDRGDDVRAWVAQEALFKASGSRREVGGSVRAVEAPLPGFVGALAILPTKGEGEPPVEVRVHDRAESAAALAALPAQRSPR